MQYQSVALQRTRGSLASVPTATILVAVLVVVALLAAFGGSSVATSASFTPASTATTLSPELAKLATERPADKVEVIVQLRRDANLALGRDIVGAVGGKAGREVKLINAIGARMTAAAAMRLAAFPQVHAVSLNGKVAPRVNKASLKAFTNSVGAMQAWKDHGATGKGIGVAVVDTGIAGDLPDFRLSRTNKLSRVRVSAVVNDAATNPGDQYGHGTHIAGLIAGNGVARDMNDDLRGDFVGVAPQAHLINIKASDDHGRTSVLDVIYGIQFAVDHKDAYNIRVLNLSLSSTTAESYRTDPLAAAAEAAWFKGIVVVAAAGNAGSAPDAVQYAPGNDPFIISVGAVKDQDTVSVADDKLADWSSRGKTQDGHVKPEVLAPGASMISTLAPNSDFETMCPECVVSKEYFQAGGTSMAAAVASGTVALLLQKRPNLTPNQVKALLISSARNVPGVGEEISISDAIAGGKAAASQAATQNFPANELVDPATGNIDYAGAKWSGAKWRTVDAVDPSGAKWSAASWRCAECMKPESAQVDPSAASWRAASWRAASWRTSFTK
jgi:serine protease AprX